jgi:translation initiation factor eIF-2B subunit epsilon
MSNQSKKPAAAASSNADTLRQEEKLQAVIILDSYSNKFEPFSSQRPECLLPLVGDRTLLDSSVEFLIENEVKELVLFCTRHHAQIKAYVDSKSWNKHFQEIHFLYNFKCQSLGDALREIDAKGLVRANFILVTATSVITNIKLKDHLELHKQTCKNDKNAVMTIMCLNKVNELAASNDVPLHPDTMLIHNASNRILHYETVSSEAFNRAKHVNIPTQLLENAYNSSKQQSNAAVDAANAKFRLFNDANVSNLTATSGYQGGTIDTISHLKTIQQRNDLLESQVYLCNPYVLHIFTDNFDYDSMTDFVHGVLVNEEVQGYTIYIDTFARKCGSYFSLVNNLNTYYNETMRLLQRPDIVLDFNTRANYRRMLDRIHVHLSKSGLRFGNECVFTRNVFVEANTRIGERCELTNCYIGANCVIGDNVKLANVIVWPNTRIGSDCRVRSAFIGNNVRIGNDCMVS